MEMMDWNERVEGLIHAWVGAFMGLLRASECTVNRPIHDQSENEIDSCIHILARTYRNTYNNHLIILRM